MISTSSTRYNHNVHYALIHKCNLLIQLNLSCFVNVLLGLKKYKINVFVIIRNLETKGDALY